MRSIKELSFVFVLFMISNIGVAQKNILPQSVMNHKITVGDTIVFRFNESIAIYPHYNWNLTFNNEYHHRNDTPSKLEGYMGGYLYAHPLYYKKGKKPIFVYKSLDNKYTPSSAIADKAMVVMNVQTKEFSSSVGDAYYEVTLLNLSDGDTVLLRSQTASLDRFKIRLFDSIYMHSLTQILEENILNHKYYQEVYKDDTMHYDKRITAITSWRTRWVKHYDYYKEIRIVGVKCSYHLLDQIHPDILVKYEDNYGNITNYECNYLLNSPKFLTVEELNNKEYQQMLVYDSIQNAELEAKRNSGYYYFELTKVDKPQNQNVKKGTLTENNVYEDNIISIKWNQDNMQFNFNLKNMTNNTIKVIWDEALIVNFDGFTERVLHKGADMDALKQSQQPSIIPSLAQLADYFWSERYFGGNRLVAGYGGGNNGGINDGKQMRLILPVQVGNTTYTYSFTFTLKWKWRNPELRKL